MIMARLLSSEIIYLRSGVTTKVQLKNAGLDHFSCKASAVIGRAFNLDNQVKMLLRKKRIKLISK